MKMITEYQKLEKELEITRRALWIMVDKVAERASIELLFGEGTTGADLIFASMRTARRRIKKEGVK